MPVLDSDSIRSNLAQSLAQGITALSKSQEVVFSVYQKSIVPTDGYVFYVNTGQTKTIQGSLHYSLSREQNEDETNDVTRVIFSALKPIDTFNAIGAETLFIGTMDGVRFAFSSQGKFYEQASVYHYLGLKVTPAFASQLIDSAADLPAGPIVSNSLPIWLARTTVGPVYPSFLVPTNITPPYIAVHVDPDRTQGAHFPIFTWPGVQESGSDPSSLYDLPAYQLSQDAVRLTLYGFTNQQAIQYLASLMEYSFTEVFGFANTPTIRDEKRTQSELSAIAMKKTIDILAWYYQSAADAVARRLILSANLGTLNLQ